MLENLLVKTDSLIEKIFRFPQEKQPVSFSRYLTAPRKILLIPGATLADVYLVGGFIPPLANKFPEAQIFLLVNQEHQCLVDETERIKTIAVDHRSPHQFDGEFRRTINRLRSEEFDWAVNLTVSGRAEALLTGYSAARIRIGVPGDECEKYYNLIVRNTSPGGDFVDIFGHLFRALLLEQPCDPGFKTFKFTEAENKRARQFLRHRRSARTGGEFRVLLPYWTSGGKGVERLLQKLAGELTAGLDPLHLLIAANMVAFEELRKWVGVEQYLYEFDDLRSMFATLSFCDRVLTNNAGAACILAGLGTKVGLIATGGEEIAWVGSRIPEQTEVLKGEQGEFPMERAVSFTK
ncbi:MAG: hypothetical protein V1794_06760 [Candidatus Glassbacteria bacterium]